MFRMFWYEIKMDFLRSIRYRFGMISDLLVYFALFTVFMVTDSGNSYAQTYHYGNYKELVLLGYVAWIYAISAISNVAGSLQSELTHGTLYKKVSSKYPLQYLFGGLYVSSVVLETITIVIVVIISKFVWGIEFSFHPAFLVPILLESLGMYGIGLIVAGIAIYFKRTGTIVFLIQTALLFVTDTVPTSDAILKITHYIPLTRCNEILRQIAVGGEYTGMLPGLCIVALVWLVIGSVFFDVMLKQAKKRGNLLFY